MNNKLVYAFTCNASLRPLHGKRRVQRRCRLAHSAGQARRQDREAPVKLRSPNTQDFESRETYATAANRRGDGITHCCVASVERVRGWSHAWAGSSRAHALNRSRRVQRCRLAHSAGQARRQDGEAPVKLRSPNTQDFESRETHAMAADGRGDGITQCCVEKLRGWSHAWVGSSCAHAMKACAHFCPLNRERRVFPPSNSGISQHCREARSARQTGVSTLSRERRVQRRQQTGEVAVSRAV